MKAVNERGMSIPEAAKTFEVGSATVERHLRRYHETGDLQARHQDAPADSLNTKRC